MWIRQSNRVISLFYPNNRWIIAQIIGWPVCKTVRPMLSIRCPVCLSVCLSVTLVYCVLWPNGWTDQDETWHAGTPWPWPHCVRWGPSSSSPKGAQPQFLAHICCGQMAGWIKIALGMEVGLGLGHIVLDGTQLPSPKREQSPQFLVHSVVAKRLDGSRCHLVRR